MAVGDSRSLKVKVETERFHDLSAFFEKFDSKRIRQAIAIGLNEHAAEQKRRVKVTLTAQTGVPGGTVGSYLSVGRASAGSLVAKVIARGPYRPLGEQGASWNRSMRGAQATAWNRTVTYPGTFVRNGIVLMRVGKSRYPLQILSGPVIPSELLRADKPTLPGAEAYVALDLKRRVLRHLGRI